MITIRRLELLDAVSLAFIVARDAHYTQINDDDDDDDENGTYATDERDLGFRRHSWKIYFPKD